MHQQDRMYTVKKGGGLRWDPEKYQHKRGIQKAHRKNRGDQRDGWRIKGVYNHKSSEKKAFQEEKGNGVKF